MPFTPALVVVDMQIDYCDLVVKKNLHPDVMMYSGFKDTHGNTKNEMAEGAASHHLEDELKAKGVTDMFCVGTARDFCVAHTNIQKIAGL